MTHAEKSFDPDYNVDSQIFFEGRPSRLVLAPAVLTSVVLLAMAIAAFLATDSTLPTLEIGPDAGELGRMMWSES